MHRLRWLDRSEQEIDAWSVQSVGDGEVVETGCRKRERDRRRCFLKGNVKLRGISGIERMQIVSVMTLGKTTYQTGDVDAIGGIKDLYSLLA